MKKRLTPLQAEWEKIIKQEAKFLEKKYQKSESKLNQLLEKKIPAGLQNTLDTAFSKAFFLVFEKGTGLIEKTYKKDDLQTDYKINEYASDLKGSKKSLKVFSKKASSSAAVNLVLSGASGIGLGVLGIGLPDIALFTGLMLKSVYEIALNFGFNYEDEEEKKFILLIIEGALSYGEELRNINEELNFYMDYDKFSVPRTVEEGIKRTAGCLSGELLYMKFLQGIPVVGAAGGAYDAIYMQQIVSYAELKYRRRFLLRKQKQELQKR